MFVKLRDHMFGPIVVFDLDSTLCDTQHRRQHAPPNDKMHLRLEWRQYAQSCLEDPPIEGSVVLARILAKHYPLYILSYRDDTAMNQTLSWLHLHSINASGVQLSSDEDAGEMGHDGYKVAMVKKWSEQYGPVQLVIDDQVSLRTAMAAIDVPVLSPQPGYHDHVGTSWTPKSNGTVAWETVPVPQN